MPHPPFYVDSNGVDNKYDVIVDEMNRELYKNTFISYLKHANKVAEKILLTIREKDSTGLIVMMSDHGFRSIFGKDFPKDLRVNNICKVYFPNANTNILPDTITNVNFFRFLFNSQFNQNFKYLKDSTFLEKEII